MGSWRVRVVAAGVLSLAAIAAQAAPWTTARVAPRPEARALVVRGAIGAGFAEAVRAGLDAQPATRVLVVHSHGGRLGEARDAAALLNARGVAVRIDGRCASACALLWALADAREMTVGSRLGLHRSSWPVALPVAIRRWAEARSDDRIAQSLRAAGFSRRLVARGRRTPPAAMHWVDALSLKREDVAFVLRPEDPADLRGRSGWLPRGARG